MRIMFVLVLAIVLSLGALQVAFAHAKLDHCTPAVDATVAQVPGQVVCVMSEEIDTKFSTISVWDANGVQVDKKDAHVGLNDPDHKTLIVSLDPSSMKDGVYTVRYHTVTPDDGGVTDGTFQFVAGGAATTSTQALTSTVVTSTLAVTPTVAPMITPTPASQPTPAALPSTGESQTAIGLMVGVGLLGLAIAGSGMAIRRFTR